MPCIAAAKKGSFFIVKNMSTEFGTNMHRNPEYPLASDVTGKPVIEETKKEQPVFPDLNPVIDLDSYKKALASLGVDGKSLEKAGKDCNSSLASADFETRKRIAFGLRQAIEITENIGKHPDLKGYIKKPNGNF